MPRRPPELPQSPEDPSSREQLVPTTRCPLEIAPLRHGVGMLTKSDAAPMPPTPRNPDRRLAERTWKAVLDHLIDTRYRTAYLGRPTVGVVAGSVANSVGHPTYSGARRANSGIGEGFRVHSRSPSATACRSTPSGRSRVVPERKGPASLNGQQSIRNREALVGDPLLAFSVGPTAAAAVGDMTDRLPVRRR